MPRYRVLLPQLRRRTGARSRGSIRGLVQTDQRGFSLIEILIAMGIFSIIAMFTLGSLASGLNGVLLGKRREVAIQEANQLLEIARSLSYNDVGLVQPPADPTVDPAQDDAIELDGTVLSFDVNGTLEPLMWATNAVGHLFNPHKSTVSRGSTKLTRYVYVSGVDTSGDDVPDIKRVTVRVSWPGSGAPRNEVRAQTMINESGVVPTVPGSGGTITSGLTPLTSKTFATGGSLSVSSPLLGLGAPLHLNLPTSDGSSTFRAVSNTNCTTKSADLEVENLVDLDGYAVSVTADDDSRTPTSSQPSDQSSSGLLTIPAGPVNTLLGASIGSPISCEASVNPLGHELGTASALSALNAQTNVTALGGLLNWLLTLASVQTQPVSQSIDHEVVDDQREVYANSTAAGGLVNVLKIPGVIGDGLVRVDALDYGASVRAAEGTPSAAPTVTAPTINLRVFDNGNKLPNGSVCQSHSGGYCIISVDPSAAGFTGLSINVTHNFTELVGLNLVNLSYTTSVDILPPSKSSLAGETGPNGERRWSAEYTPLTISAALDASVLGVSIIDADVDLNLGTVQAKGCAGATCS
jgi:prepilin-type N-terminal cleavage/methylation domain-containing protein